MSFICSRNRSMATWDTCAMPISTTVALRMISNAIVRVINDGRRMVNE